MTSQKGEVDKPETKEAARQAKIESIQNAVKVYETNHKSKSLNKVIFETMLLTCEYGECKDNDVVCLKQWQDHARVLFDASSKFNRSYHRNCLTSFVMIHILNGSLLVNDDIQTLLLQANSTDQTREQWQDRLKLFFDNSVRINVRRYHTKLTELMATDEGQFRDYFSWIHKNYPMELQMDSMTPKLKVVCNLMRHPTTSNYLAILRLPEFDSADAPWLVKQFDEVATDEQLFKYLEATPPPNAKNAIYQMMVRKALDMLTRESHLMENKTKEYKLRWARLVCSSPLLWLLLRSMIEYPCQKCWSEVMTQTQDVPLSFLYHWYNFGDANRMFKAMCVLVEARSVSLVTTQLFEYFIAKQFSDWLSKQLVIQNISVYDNYFREITKFNGSEDDMQSWHCFYSKTESQTLWIGAIPAKYDFKLVSCAGASEELTLCLGVELVMLSLSNYTDKKRGTATQMKPNLFLQMWYEGMVYSGKYSWLDLFILIGIKQETGNIWATPSSNQKYTIEVYNQHEPPVGVFVKLTPAEQNVILLNGKFNCLSAKTSLNGTDRHRFDWFCCQSAHIKIGNGSNMKLHVKYDSYKGRLRIVSTDGKNMMLTLIPKDNGSEIQFYKQTDLWRDENGITFVWSHLLDLLGHYWWLMSKWLVIPDDTPLTLVPPVNTCAAMQDVPVREWIKIVFGYVEEEEKEDEDLIITHPNTMVAKVGCQSFVITRWKSDFNSQTKVMLQFESNVIREQWNCAWKQQTNNTLHRERFAIVFEPHIANPYIQFKFH